MDSVLGLGNKGAGGHGTEGIVKRKSNFNVMFQAPLEEALFNLSWRLKHKQGPPSPGRQQIRSRG
jgi:hypothetical protein